jgi:signal peptide peptidase SppA
MDISDLFEQAYERLTSPPPVVTVVRLSGIISPTGSPLRPQLSLASLAGVLKVAFKPKRLAAVALVVNSPGGSPVQSSLIAKRIRAHADERKVPVLAFVEDVAASGGYWLAVAADEIFVDPSSILGSIGVVASGFGLHEAIARLGIERRLYTQGERKRMLDPFLPTRDEDVERLNVLQSEVHQIFKDHVRQRRSGRLKLPEAELFNGDIWTGAKAVEIGLADHVGDLRSTLRQRFGDKVDIRPVGERRSWLKRFLRAETDLPAQALAAVEERLMWGRWGI